MAVEPPLLIMLVGLPGSGKSAAAERLASVTRSQGRPCEIIGTDVYLEAEAARRGLPYTTIFAEQRDLADAIMWRPRQGGHPQADFRRLGSDEPHGERSPLAPASIPRGITCASRPSCPQPTTKPGNATLRAARVARCQRTPLIACGPNSAVQARKRTSRCSSDAS